MSVSLEVRISNISSEVYVVYKHYRKDPRFEGWFKSLEPRMHRSDGRIHGFGINEIPGSH